MVREKYNMVNLSQAIEGVTLMAASAADKDARNVLYSARDYLEMFQDETEHTALTWEDLLECKHKKKANK